MIIFRNILIVITSLICFMLFMTLFNDDTEETGIKVALLILNTAFLIYFILS